VHHRGFGAVLSAAIGRRDGAQLAAAFTETVRLRALLPGGPVEAHGRQAVVARFVGWFADFDAVEVMSASDEPVADRHLVHYRLTLRRGRRRWTCTQTLIGKATSTCCVPVSASSPARVTAMAGDPMPPPWGDYDRADPFPRFARARADGPVHEVTLPDGQRAWLIVRFAEARAALNDPRLSKDMHAALARDGGVVAEGLPGPAFARHMLSVDPPDHTRLRGLAAVAFSRSRITALRPRVQAIVDGLLDDLRDRGDTVVDLVAGFAFPLPFTVISELLGVPEPDRSELGAWFTTLLAPALAPEPPPDAVAASARVVGYLTAMLDRR